MSVDILKRVLNSRHLDVYKIISNCNRNQNQSLYEDVVKIERGLLYLQRYLNNLCNREKLKSWQLISIDTKSVYSKNILGLLGLEDILMKFGYVLNANDNLLEFNGTQIKNEDVRTTISEINDLFSFIEKYLQEVFESSHDYTINENESLILCYCRKCEPKYFCEICAELFCVDCSDNFHLEKGTIEHLVSNVKPLNVEILKFLKLVVNYDRKEEFKMLSRKNITEEINNDIADFYTIPKEITKNNASSNSKTYSNVKDNSTEASESRSPSKLSVHIDVKSQETKPNVAVNTTIKSEYKTEHQKKVEKLEIELVEELNKISKPKEAKTIEKTDEMKNKEKLKIDLEQSLKELDKDLNLSISSRTRLKRLNSNKQMDLVKQEPADSDVLFNELLALDPDEERKRNIETQKRLENEAQLKQDEVKQENKKSIKKPVLGMNELDEFLKSMGDNFYADKPKPVGDANIINEIDTILDGIYKDIQKQDSLTDAYLNEKYVKLKENMKYINDPIKDSFSYLQFRPILNKWFKAKDVELVCNDLIELCKNPNKEIVGKECDLCMVIQWDNNFIKLPTCECKVCKSCFKLGYTTYLNEPKTISTIKKFSCLRCQQPEIINNRDELNYEYIVSLAEKIRMCCEKESFEKFNELALYANIMKDPNFRWCVHCENGFLGNNYQTKIQCNNCNKWMCLHCKLPWEDQHENISCMQYKQWKEDNNSDNQKNLLNNLLENNGLLCPKCGAVYVLDRGGCLHLECKICNFVFCQGCGLEMKKTSTHGLYANHPRNCFYNLRDASTDDLLKLIKLNNVSFDLPVNAKNSVKCEIVERTNDGKPEDCKDALMNLNNQIMKYCEKHMKEYLTLIINKHDIEPILVYNEKQLEAIITKNNLTLPSVKENQDRVEIYKKFITAQLPLPNLTKLRY